MEVYTGEDPYIFISYAHDDSERVLPIISYIANEEYRVWFDQRIEVGTKWAEAIAQRLNQSACFMAFITDNYLQSDNCMDEIEYAKNKKKPILIIYLEDLQIPDWFLMRHGRTQSIYYKEYNAQNEFFERIYEVSVLSYCRKSNDRYSYESNDLLDDISNNYEFSDLLGDLLGDILDDYELNEKEKDYNLNSTSQKDKFDVSDNKIEKIKEILRNKAKVLDEQMKQISDENPYTYTVCLRILELISNIMCFVCEEGYIASRVSRDLREMMKNIQEKEEKIRLEGYDNIKREFLELFEKIRYWIYKIPYENDKKRVFEYYDQLLLCLEGNITVEDIKYEIENGIVSKPLGNLMLNYLIRDCISYIS